MKKSCTGYEQERSDRNNFLIARLRADSARWGSHRLVCVREERKEIDRDEREKREGEEKERGRERGRGERERGEREGERETITFDTKY